MKNKKSKLIKWIIVLLVLIIAFISIFMIYKNLFASSNNTRYENIENHKLKNNEINSVKDVLGEIEQVSNIDIFINSKIIEIVVDLEEDVDFEQIKSVSNKALEKFSEKNLKFYDVQIYIKSMNEESEIYPQIGYNHKSNSEFSW